MTRLWLTAALCIAAAAQPQWQPDLSYVERDGSQLKLDLARPPDDGFLHPLVVFVHGGAWRSGSKAAYAPVLQMLAARGYAAAAIDYRLAPRHRFPAQQEDIAAALQFLAAHAREWSIDTRRAALAGDSAGGHLALMQALRPPAGSSPAVTIRAVINIFGVADLPTWHLSTEGEKLEGLTAGQILAGAFGTSDRSSPILKDASPLTWLRAGGPAILTLHGDADPVVPIAQARLLHQRLQELGVPERLEVLPGAGHTIAANDIPQAVALTLSHLNTYLGSYPSAAFQRIDSHAHIAPPPPAFLALLDQLNIRLLNVTLIDPFQPGYDKPEPIASMAAAIAAQAGGRISWAAALDSSGFESPSYAARESARLRADFARGAVAVKMYKAIGLRLQDALGLYVLPDHPAFSPVLETIEKDGRTLLTHLAEPLSSWSPLDPKDPHSAFYRLNPAWHMAQHPERPSWQAVIDARDRMLAAHPRLRVIGCHLGSMEHDVDEIAKRLDRFPNFAVDTTARLPNLMLQPRDKVRSFFLKYQDRILWGTDLMELEWKDPASAIQRTERMYTSEWRYLVTSDSFPTSNGPVQGLALPEPVARKIFHENALKWIPLLNSSAGSKP